VRRLAPLLLLGAACHAAPEGPDPAVAEVRLAAAPGWEASLVLDRGDVGVWTVVPADVFPQFGPDEVVGLDDDGRCIVCVPYSGRFTPFEVLDDGEWLGGVAFGDVDPRVAGPELYVGGASGRLYVVRGDARGDLEGREIAELADREIHTLVAGDYDPRTAGEELLVFTEPGALWRVTPGDGARDYDVELLDEQPGRVRHAVALPASDTPTLVTVSRAGRLELLTIAADGPRRTLIHAEHEGMGRVALRPPADGAPLALYTALDDGRILRHVREPGGDFATSTIYLGPKGPRGIAAGSFHADPEVESVAVFGYSGRVELLTRTGDGWTVETVFTARDRGHWLAACELDGRNATTELLASGYGGRIVLLSRPPGTGRDELTGPR
jgi:hypothetical protein